MALKKLYIDGTPGLTHIEHPDLFGAEIMLVMREGKPLVETTDVPAGRRFRHEGTRIKVDDSIPITEVAVSIGTSEFLKPEDFYVEYKN